ncbi:hypothetical protein BC936DRAFT_137458, partial [Jimgerdemannia flammicorona]
CGDIYFGGLVQFVRQSICTRQSTVNLHDSQFAPLPPLYLKPYSFGRTWTGTIHIVANKKTLWPHKTKLTSKSPYWTRGPYHSDMTRGTPLTRFGRISVSANTVREPLLF